jgi:hypothetical protein
MEEFTLKRIKVKFQISACMIIASTGIMLFSILTDKAGFAYFSLAVIIFALLYSLFALVRMIDILNYKFSEGRK